MIIKLHWFSNLLDHALFHDDTICHCHCLNLIMCNINCSCSHLTMKSADLCSHTDTEFRIQVGKRLIHQEYFLIFYDGTTKCNPLSLSTGKILRFSVTKFLQSQNINRPVYFFLDLICRHFHILQTISDIFLYCHMRVQCVVLEYHCNTSVSRSSFVYFFSINIQITFCNLLKSGYHAKCC